MIEQRLFKVEAGDAEQCQGLVRNGQCPFRQEPGSIYCKIHVATSVKEKNSAKAIRNYQLSKWQARVNDFADNQSVKSLREEIGISRMVLETILDKCQDNNDILLYSGKIVDCVMKIEKVVASCHRLEQSTGMLLDKSSILQIAGTIVEIISKHIEDSTILETISDEIISTIIVTQIIKE